MYDTYLTVKDVGLGRNRRGLLHKLSQRSTASSGTCSSPCSSYPTDTGTSAQTNHYCRYALPCCLRGYTIPPSPSSGMTALPTDLISYRSYLPTYLLIPTKVLPFLILFSPFILHSLPTFTRPPLPPPPLFTLPSPPPLTHFTPLPLALPSPRPLHPPFSPYLTLSSTPFYLFLP